MPAEMNTGVVCYFLKKLIVKTIIGDYGMSFMSVYETNVVVVTN